MPLRSDSAGWAKSPRFAFGRRADYSIPMSDHCDYSELLRMVRQSGAETVYTTHGFEEEFARDLQKKLGIDAVPLTAAGAARSGALTALRLLPHPEFGITWQTRLFGGRGGGKRGRSKRTDPYGAIVRPDTRSVAPFVSTHCRPH